MALVSGHCVVAVLKTPALVSSVSFRTLGRAVIIRNYPVKSAGRPAI